MQTISDPTNNFENLGSILSDDSCCPTCHRSFSLTWAKRNRDLELQAELAESELRFQLRSARERWEADLAERSTEGAS